MIQWKKAPDWESENPGSTPTSHLTPPSLSLHICLMGMKHLFRLSHMMQMNNEFGKQAVN